MTRKSLLILLPLLMAGLLFSSCNRKEKRSNRGELPADLITNPGSAEGQQDIPMAEIRFIKTEHDFGTIKEGEKVYWNFRFTNAGATDLIINRVKADCGCTAPDYPKTPIKPGEDGKIKVTFDSKGRSGMQIKKVTVLSNSQRPTNVLTISAIVEK